eukprot:scaffold4357_cov113-Isochrysis_galbana.AAC.3
MPARQRIVQCPVTFARSHLIFTCAVRHAPARRKLLCCFRSRPELAREQAPQHLRCRGRLKVRAHVCPTYDWPGVRSSPGSGPTARLSSFACAASSVSGVNGGDDGCLGSSISADTAGRVEASSAASAPLTLAPPRAAGGGSAPANKAAVAPGESEP